MVELSWRWYRLWRKHRACSGTGTAGRTGISADEIQTDDQVIHVAIGAVVGGIPKANLFYRVDVPADKIKATDHVIESGWFEPDELKGLYISPSTGDKARLIEVVKKQLDTLD